MSWPLFSSQKRVFFAWCFCMLTFWLCYCVRFVVICLHSANFVRKILSSAFYSHLFRWIGFFLRVTKALKITKGWMSSAYFSNYIAVIFSFSHFLALSLFLSFFSYNHLLLNMHIFLYRHFLGNFILCVCVCVLSNSAYMYNFFHWSFFPEDFSVFFILYVQMFNVCLLFSLANSNYL